MPPIGNLSRSPVLKILFPIDAPFISRPFGNSTSYNVLNYFLGTPEIATQVGYSL